MPRRKLPYRVGDLFAVPVEGGGYVVGLIARSDGRGGNLGYFFGPRRETVPALNELHELQAQDAILIKIFGDLELLGGTWPILGPLPGWRPEAWPLPDFGRRDVVSGQPLRVRYNEATLMEISHEKISVEALQRLPPSGVAGAQYIEEKLNLILSRA